MLFHPDSMHKMSGSLFGIIKDLILFLLLFSKCFRSVSCGVPVMEGVSRVIEALFCCLFNWQMEVLKPCSVKLE